MIDLKATAIAGTALIVATLVAFMVELARGQDGSPYSWLAAVAGVVLLVAVLVLRTRS